MKNADAVLETRRRLNDLEQRIDRQQRRIAKILVERDGPAEEMMALLDDMIKARDGMQAQLSRWETEDALKSRRG